MISSIIAISSIIIRVLVLLLICIRVLVLLLTLIYILTINGMWVLTTMREIRKQIPTMNGNT